MVKTAVESDTGLWYDIGAGKLHDIQDSGIEAAGLYDGIDAGEGTLHYASIPVLQL